jgi:hypothetical protein
MVETQNVNLPGLAEEVLAILRCLDCQDRLRSRAHGIVCANCGREYALLNGVLRFVDAQNYAGSFGFQWKLYSRTQLDDASSQRSERAFRRRTGFRPETSPANWCLTSVAEWAASRKSPHAGVPTWWEST